MGIYSFVDFKSFVPPVPKSVQDNPGASLCFALAAISVVAGTAGAFAGLNVIADVTLIGVGLISLTVGSCLIEGEEDTTVAIEDFNTDGFLPGEEAELPEGTLFSTDSDVEDIWDDIIEYDDLLITEEELLDGPEELEDGTRATGSTGDDGSEQNLPDDFFDEPTELDSNKIRKILKKMEGIKPRQQSQEHA